MQDLAGVLGRATLPTLRQEHREMSKFTVQELQDLLSTVEGDKIGKHGDERSLRLDKLENKLARAITQAKKETK